MNPESTAQTFFELCESGTLKQVQDAIAQGANVNERSQHGGTPLMSATKNTNVDVIGLLLRAGADINAQTVKGQTALMIGAMESANPAVIDALIKAGADPNVQNQYGWTALKWAAQENPNPDVITALIRGGCDVKFPGLLDVCANRNRNKDKISAVLKAAGDLMDGPSQRKPDLEQVTKSLRRYVDGEQDAAIMKTLMSSSGIRVLDMFPSVSDELFECFVNLTRRSALESGFQKAIPMRWALDALNAVCVRLRESSPNQGVAEFMLAIWSVKYTQALDQNFFTGLQELKLAARSMYESVDAQQTNIERLNFLEGLCKSSEREKFARYPGMEEMVRLFRQSG